MLNSLKIRRDLSRIVLFIIFYSYVFVQGLLANALQPDKINLAIRRSLDQLLRSENDSTTKIPVIHQINDSTWQSEGLPDFNYEKFPNLLQKSLDVFNINNKYHVVIRSCVSREILLGYSQFDLIHSKELPCQGRERTKECKIIEVQYSNNELPQFAHSGGKWFYIIPIILIFSGLVLYSIDIPLNKRMAKNEITQNILQFGLSKLDLNNHHLIVHEQINKLTYREAKLLQYFIENKGKILGRDTILKKVWGDEGVQVSRSLDVFVSRLRKLIQHDHTLEIATIHGIGYRFDVLNISGN